MPSQDGGRLLLATPVPGDGQISGEAGYGYSLRLQAARCQMYSYTNKKWVNDPSEPLRGKQGGMGGGDNLRVEFSVSPGRMGHSTPRVVHW